MQFEPSAKRVALLGPVDVGQNLTVIVLVAPVPREKLPLPEVISNWSAFVPVKDTVPVAVPPPMFCSVKDRVPEHWPTWISPKGWLDGVSSI